MLKLDKLNQLTESHGELRPGHGMVTRRDRAVAGASCASWACWPSTSRSTSRRPSCARAYNVDIIRKMMLAALVLAGSLARCSTSFVAARAGCRPRPLR